jgi:hypothetical protein
MSLGKGKDYFQTGALKHKKEFRLLIGLLRTCLSSKFHLLSLCLDGEMLGRAEGINGRSKHVFCILLFRIK